MQMVHFLRSRTTGCSDSTATKTLLKVVSFVPAGVEVELEIQLVKSIVIGLMSQNIPIVYMPNKLSASLSDAVLSLIAQSGSIS